MLTDEQVQILSWLAEGLQFKAIAKLLDIDCAVAERRGMTIRKKLGAKTAPHAVAIALSLGMIPPLKAASVVPAFPPRTRRAAELAGAGTLSAVF